MPHPIVLALLITLGAREATAREAVSLPVSCEVRAGRLIVRSSLPTDHEIASERQRQVFSACRPGKPNECRPVLVYRFDVACGTERVKWLDLAAALLSAYGSTVWIEDERLHIRPRPAQRLGRCDSGDPAFSFMKDCDPWSVDQSAASAWVLPAGFAPVHEVGARFVELPPAVAAASPRPEPSPGPVGRDGGPEPQAPDPIEARSAAAAGPEPPAAPGADRNRESEALEPSTRADAAIAAEASPGERPDPALAADAEPRAARFELAKAEADGEPAPSAGEQHGEADKDLHTVSVSGWSSSVVFADEEAGAQPGLQFLTALEDIGAGLRHLRLEQEFTVVLMGIALLSGLLSGIGWYSARARRTRSPSFRVVEPQTVSFRPSTALLVPSDEKMCGELCRTAHTMLQQIDARVDELQGVAPLRRVLQREMRNLEQFLTAVMTASPAEPEEWRRMRNRLQRIVKELHRLRDIVEGAYRSLSGGGFTSREPPRDKFEAYEALGVNPDVSPKTLKKLVDALRACWHPDLAKDETDRLAREERMKRINIAWDIITAKRQEA